MDYRTYSYVETRLEELRLASHNNFDVQGPSVGEQLREAAGEALIAFGKRLKPKKSRSEVTASTLNPGWAGR